MITLRPRQIELESKIKEACRRLKLKNPTRALKIIVQAPCGFGKTPLMVKMIKGAEAKGKKILFLAPKKELINQCSKMLGKNAIEHGVLNNPKKANINALVQLSCPETMANIIEKFKKRTEDVVLFENEKATLRNFDIIFYDECHGSAAETASRVLNHYENSDLFGFSATPYRDDLKGLGVLYDELVESCSMKDLISDGLLVKPEYHVCNTEITTTEAITFDSNSNETSTIDADIIINADIIRNFINICGHARTAVFCSSIEKAEEIAEKFRKAGKSAKSVDSKTKSKEREQILEDFDKKKFQILCNAVLLKEGWDCPDLECVIILRRLQSRIFYRQAAARCMRTSPNNPDKKAYILDFFNCVEKFDLPWEDEIYSLTETVQSDPKDKEIEEKDEKGSFCDKPGCLTFLDPGVNVCPICGTGKTKGQKVVVEAVADLKKIDESKIVTKSDKQIEYDRLCALCIDNQWKPKAVDAKYKSKFGVWPRGIVKTPNFQKYCEEYSRTELNKKFELQKEFSNTQFSL
jgi:DNA repair protein RadD